MNYIIISSILLSLSFFLILIFSKNNKTIKYLFLVLSILFISLILLNDNNFIYSFLKTIITYLWYPNYLLFVITIFFSIIIFVYCLIKEKKLINKIIGYILFCFSFSNYVIYLSSDIDINKFENLYSIRSLTIMRIENIIFILGMITYIIFKIRGKYEK